ncbi:MAG: Gfo/Idh/MocA family oxidoreductase [Oscillospiraceae bacterium]|nr:Gfo/Idh/MocA family oxidoreductase [Oscillospiraceae bacterium]
MKKVITYGSFDLFHEGHYNLLKRAKALGDELIVGVTTEQYDVYRGKMNVVDSLMRRIDNVRQSGLADEIIVEDHEGQKVEDIQKYGIDIIAFGSDWVDKFDYLKEYCEVVYFDRTQNVSSTILRHERLGVVNLGIVGTGRIAERLFQEAKFVSGVDVSCAYNPRQSSARKFGEAFEVAYCHDSYEAFLDKVDAVYVATPHETHYDYARRALILGKHVLCEKPMVLSELEARELYNIADENKVVLMEAVKTAYAPGFINLLAIARGGRIGTIYDVEAAFTKLTPYGPGIREYDPAVGGSFTELASYSLLPIVKLLGHDYKSIAFESFRTENGTDLYTKAHFKYDNATATAKTGIGVKSEGQLIVSGTKGYILAKSPWWLLKSFEVCYERTHENETFSAPFPGFGLRFELADFVRNISDTTHQNYKFSKEDSIFMSIVMEQFLKSTRRREKYEKI